MGNGIPCLNISPHDVALFMPISKAMLCVSDKTCFKTSSRDARNFILTSALDVALTTTSALMLGLLRSGLPWEAIPKIL